MITHTRIAVFSDIHSNYHAFRACYEDAAARGVTGFVFLGDYVSDLAEPERTMDLVFEIRSRYPTVCLLGNRERYMLEHDRCLLPFVPGSKSGSLLFTYEHLRQRDLDFFRSLPISDTVCLGGVTFEIAHAFTEDDRCWFDGSDKQTEAIFQQMKCNYLLTGHSHRQYIRHHAGKTILNPGSVGIPQGGTPYPKYAIVQIADGTVSCSLHEVPYDLRSAIHSQFQNGLVSCARYWAIGILYDIITGQECVLELLKRVNTAGNVYSEDAWHSAAVQLGMCVTETEIIDFYQKRFPNFQSTI